VSPVRYELGYYIPEDVILNSHRRGKPQILYSINWVGALAGTQCVVCEVRTGHNYYVTAV
jgi:hypothetical protein